MNRILDYIAAQRTAFTPEDWRQYLALQLARKLNDLPRLHLYVQAVQMHSFEYLANAVAACLRLPKAERSQALLSELSN